MEKLYITEEIANHPANEGLGLKVGAELLNSDPIGLPETCGGVEKPAKPAGQVGEYLCNGSSWVWVPAV